MSKNRYNAEILGTGSYLPVKGLNDYEIVRRWGNFKPRDRERVRRKVAGLRKLFGEISDRREAEAEEVCSDILVKAAEEVLVNSDKKVQDLGMIIVSSTPGDGYEPATAAAVQGKLMEKLGGNLSCPADDVKGSCVGWMKGIDDAFRYTEDYGNVLVLAGTKIGNLTGERTEQRYIFGDGAAGVLIGESKKESVRKIKRWNFGEYADAIYLSHSQSVHEKRGYFMANKGILEKALAENIGELGGFWEGVDKEGIDHAFVHKASNGLFEGVIGMLDLNPKTEIYQSYDNYGNTVSADMLIALDEAVHAGKVKRGQKLFFFSYGAGISAGAMLMEY